MLEFEKIRSAQFVDSYYPMIDGVVQVVHNYASIMNRTSYSCVVCPKASGGFDDASLPYDVFRTASLRLPIWQYAIAWPVNDAAVRRLQRLDLNILHVHSPFTQRDCALRLARRNHIPLVTTFHTKYYDDALRISHSKNISKAVVSSIVSFYDKCDSVWACSEGAAETLHSYGYKGKVEVMVNGTNFRRPADPDRLADAARKQFGISKDGHNLLFVGTQVWQKNMRLVLDTMKVLKGRGGAFRLYVAGTGYDAQHIKDYAASLGLADDVIFLGRVSDRSLLAGLYMNADLFFFPSVYDTSALVVREAAVMGKPSLLVKGSAAACVIEPDVNGFVAAEDPASMADKILSVIDDKKLLALAGQNAAATIPVSWEDLVQNVYAKYAEIIDTFQHR